MPGGVREIPLTRGLVTLVDEADFGWLSQWKWFARPDDYAARTPSKARNKTLFMHREIMCAAPGDVLDHINGNRLDNRRANLRFCTIAENGRNGRPRGASSGFKGVTFFKSPAHWRKPWRASITLDGRSHSLGLHPTAEEAARAYDEAAIRLHGEFARLNFPDPGQPSALSEAA